MNRLLLLCHTVLLFGGGIFYSVAFECPPVARQRFVPDPEDCSKYYQCLSSGKSYHKPCAKGLLFDSKYRMCNWPSASTCKGSRPDADVEDSPNLIHANYESKTERHYPTAWPTRRAETEKHYPTAWPTRRAETEKHYPTAWPTRRAETTRTTARDTTRTAPRFRSYQKVEEANHRPNPWQPTTRRYHKATMSTRRTSKATTVKYTRRPKTKRTTVKLTRHPTTKRRTRRPNFAETTKKLVRYHTTRPTQKRGRTSARHPTTKAKSRQKTPRVSRRWMTSPFKFTKTVRQTTREDNTTPPATSTKFSTRAKLSSVTVTSTTKRTVPTTTKVVPKIKQLVKAKSNQKKLKSPYLTTPRVTTTGKTDKPKTTNTSQRTTTTEPTAENSTSTDQIVTGALWLVLDLPTENELYKEGSGDTDDVESNTVIDQKAEMEKLKMNPQPLRRDPPLPGLSQITGVECTSSFALEDDPSTCDGFYQCYMWIPYAKACPAGLKFDTSSKVCNWPEEVLCADGTKDTSADDDYYDEYEYYYDYYDEDEDETKTTATPVKKTKAPKKTKKPPQGPQNPKTDEDDEYEYYYYEGDDDYYDDSYDYPDASKHMSDLGDIPSPIDNGVKGNTDKTGEKTTKSAGKNSTTTPSNTTVAPTTVSANITTKQETQMVFVNATKSSMNMTNNSTGGIFNATTAVPSNGTTTGVKGTTVNRSSDATTDSDIVLDEGIAQGYKSILKDISTKKKTTVPDRKYDIESSGDDGTDVNVLFQNIELYQVATDKDALHNQTISKINNTNEGDTTSKGIAAMNATSTNIVHNTTSPTINATTTTKVQSTQKPTLITTIVPENTTTIDNDALNKTTGNNADKNISTTKVVKAVKLNANILSTTNINKSETTLSSNISANATTINPFNNTTTSAFNSTIAVTTMVTSTNASKKPEKTSLNTTTGDVSTTGDNTITTNNQTKKAVSISQQTITVTGGVISSKSPTKPPQKSISVTDSDVGKDPVKANAPLMDVITDELGKSRGQKSSNKAVGKKGSSMNKVRTGKCNATADICKRRQLMKKKLKQRRKLKKKNGRKQKKLANKRNKALQNARESSKLKLTKASLIKIVLATKSTNGWDGTKINIKTNTTASAPTASSSAPTKTSANTQTVSASKSTGNSSVNAKAVHVNANDTFQTTPSSSKTAPTTTSKSVSKNKTIASKFNHQISKAIDDTTSLKKQNTSSTTSTTKLQNNINTITNPKISNNSNTNSSKASTPSSKSTAESALNSTTNNTMNKTVAHDKTNSVVTKQKTAGKLSTDELNINHVSSNAVVTKTTLLSEKSSDVLRNEKQTTASTTSKIVRNTQPINKTITSKNTKVNTKTTDPVTSSKAVTNANGTLVNSVTTIMQKTPASSLHPKTTTNQKYDNTIATPSDKIKSKNDVIVLDKAYESTEIILLPSNFTVPSYDDLLTSKKDPELKNVLDKKQKSLGNNITSTLSDLINSTKLAKNETTVAKDKNTSPKPQQNIKDRLLTSTAANVRSTVVSDNTKLMDNSNSIVNQNDAHANINAVKQDVSGDKLMPRAAAYRNRKFERDETSRNIRGVPDNDDDHRGERYESSGSDRLGTSIIVSMILGLCFHLIRH